MEAVPEAKKVQIPPAHYLMAVNLPPLLPSHGEACLLSGEPVCLPQHKRENNPWVCVTSDVFKCRRIKQGKGQGELGGEEISKRLL